MFFSLSFCDRLFSQLHQLERDSLRRLECLGRRVEAAALVARARAARFVHISFRKKMFF